MKRSSITPAIQAVGGCPVVIKLLEGTKGLGVMLAESQKAAEGIIETFLLTGQNVLIQDFIEESRGCDIRAIVVGNKVVAAMRRIARDDEFRSNVYLGSSLQAITLTPEFEQAAVRSSQILGLNVSGVDLIESRSGVKVLEVNSSPGLEGIEQVTGIDVAGAIIGYLEKQRVSLQHPPKQPAKRFKLEQLVTVA
jgi:ribosomal protein S6--L-glutamate ligase